MDMKKGKVATAGMISLAMLIGTPTLNVLAAEPAAVVQPQSETLTRGEFFKMLDQAIDLPKAKEKSTYKDVPQGSELSEIVNRLQAVGALPESKDDMVRPESELKAGEAIALISGVLGVPNASVPGNSSSLDSKHGASDIASWMKSIKVDYNWNDLDRTITKQEAQTLVKQLLSTSSDAKKLLEESWKAQQQIKSFRAQSDVSFDGVENQDELNKLSANERKEFEEMIKSKKGSSIKTEVVYAMPDSMYTKTDMGEIEFEQYVIGKDVYTKTGKVPEGFADNPSGWVKAKGAFPFDMKAIIEQRIPLQQEKKVFYRSTGEGQLVFQGRIDTLSELAPVMRDMQVMQGILEGAEKKIGSIYIQGSMNLEPKTKLPIDSSIQIVIPLKENAADTKDKMLFKQMTITQNVKYSDYNATEKIELPEAAKNAKELPATGANTSAPKQ